MRRVSRGYRGGMSALCLLTPTRAGFHLDPTEIEQTALARHFEFLKQLVADGRVLTAGPCDDGSLGLVVFPKLEAAEAAAVMEGDPAVAAGVFRAETRPWRMSLCGTGTARDWTGFVQAIHAKVSPAEAWRRLATPAGISSWFTGKTEVRRGERLLPPDEQLAVGDHITFTWFVPAPAEKRTPESPTVAATELDAVLEVEPGRRLRHAWYEGKGWIEYRVLTDRADGRVTVELEQRMDPANDFAMLEGAYVGCREGWAFYLTNLKAVLEHGVDLREATPDRGGLINV